MSEIEHIHTYGNMPAYLGVVHKGWPDEMLFWLYCPISLAGSSDLVIPPNLMTFEPIVRRVIDHLGSKAFADNYIYLTAKTLFVTPDNPGNRPGWHCDGFMSKDLNYVWCDRFSTEFAYRVDGFDLTRDDKISLREMEEQAADAGKYTFPVKTLLCLDETVVHRTPEIIVPGLRTFAKISVSPNRYDLIGNSVNHGLVYDWVYHERAAERNDPVSTVGASDRADQ